MASKKQLQKRLTMPQAATHMQTSGRWFAACGLWMAGLGCYFLFFRPALLPEDTRFIGTSLEILTAIAPGLAQWLGHVFGVLGGFMVPLVQSPFCWLAATLPNGLTAHSWAWL
ncbi:MAG: hypothetical protein ABIP46_00105 [Polaromonas sp.]